MDTHLNFVSKQALHYITLVIKLFNSATNLFLSYKLLPQHYEPLFF